VLRAAGAARVRGEVLMLRADFERLNARSASRTQGIRPTRATAAAAPCASSIPA